MTYNPWQDLADRHPQIHAEWTDIAPVRAAWIRRERVILIDAALNKIERRCALAHEIAHIDAGDRSTPLCWFDRRQENRADILAARRLIDLESLVAVYRLTDNILEAAAELEVTLDVMVLRAGTLRAPEKIALVNARARHEVVA